MRKYMAIDISSEIFEEEVVKSSVPVLVDFWGPKCAPCLALMPQVESLEMKYGTSFKITKVDASKNRRMCLSLKVLGLPTFLIYKDGKELARLNGDTLTIEEIETAIGNVLNGK
jgi:thioredoxin 1